MTKKATMNPALRSFWKTKARNKILYGGRNSSKSWDTASMLTFLSNSYSVRVLCCRQIQNRIDDSSYKLIVDRIESFGLLSNYRITDSKIKNVITGSEFFFYGISRNIREIKSIEGIDILWIEEAQGLTKEQWEILEPTIRKEGSECWITFNPDLDTDFVYQNFIVNTPEDTIVRKINYDENPFISKTSLKVIENYKKSHPELFDHIYLGVPRSDDDQVVIKRSWIEAAVDAHLKLGLDIVGDTIVGFDVADSGEDKCATTVRHGILTLACEEWQAGEDELLKSTDRVYQMATEYRASTIVYDSIGVGAGTGSYINQINKRLNKHMRHIGYNAGSAVFDPERMYNNIKNKDFFANSKSQNWWLIADRFRNTFNAVTKGISYNVDDLISISSDMDKNLLEKLKSELSTPKRDIDTLGRVKVESKKDMLKRGINSPNLADSFIAAYARFREGLTFSDEWKR